MWLRETFGTVRVNIAEILIALKYMRLLFHQYWCPEEHTGVDYVIERHDDVIKWKYHPRYWPCVRQIHRSPVNSPHKGQWHGALKFSLIYAWNLNKAVFLFQGHLARGRRPDSWQTRFGLGAMSRYSTQIFHCITNLTRKFIYMMIITPNTPLQWSHMSVNASQITGHSILFNSLFKLIHKISKRRISGLLWVKDDPRWLWIPTQRASDVESVSMS